MGVVEDGGMGERDYRWRDGREGLQMEGWERGSTDGRSSSVAHTLTQRPVRLEPVLLG